MSGMVALGGRMVELERQEALDLVAGVQLGRVAFSHRALPTIRPVNHLVDGGDIIIRTHAGSVLMGHALVSDVVAYEVDQIDPVERTGWSVVITGTATRVSDASELVEFQKLLTPWVEGDLGQVVRIRPGIVTGYRLVQGAGS